MHVGGGVRGQVDEYQEIDRVPADNSTVISSFSCELHSLFDGQDFVLTKDFKASRVSSLFTVRSTSRVMNTNVLYNNISG